MNVVPRDCVRLRCAALHRNPPRPLMALDISRVVALSTKAFRLMAIDGHSGHAAAKLGAAVEAARALGPAAGDDCLLVASLQLRQVDALVAHADTRSLPPGDAAEARRLAFCTLLPAAQRALLRRKAAGTLLGGTCRAHEVAWYAEAQKNEAATYSSTVNGSVRVHIVHMGYDAFLLTAHCSLNLLIDDHRVLMPSGVEFIAHAAFITAALKLFAMPRRGRTGPCALDTAIGDHMWLQSEVSIVRRMQEMDARGFFANSNGGGAAILAGWRALQHSGAIKQRGVLEGCLASELDSEELNAIAKAAAAPERLRPCALGSCGVRETYPAQYKLCGACAAGVYCCKEHQVAHWAAHKAACKAACKAARAAKDAAAER